MESTTFIFHINGHEKTHLLEKKRKLIYTNIEVMNMKKLAIRFIRFYQKSKPEGHKKWCRYHPTCSNYAIEAYEKHNFFYATLLTLFRILRCNPLFKGGYNPVPLTRREKQQQREQLKTPMDNRQGSSSEEKINTTKDGSSF